MKFPIGFRVFAIINILIGIFFCFLFIIIFFDPERVTGIFVETILLFIVLSFALWSIFASVVWIFAFRISYLVLIGTILNNIVIAVVFSLDALKNPSDNKSNFIFIAVMSFVFGLLVLFMIIFALLKSTRAYVFNSSNKPPRWALITIIATFVVTMAGPPAIIALTQAVGSRYEPVRPDYLSSSGDYGEYTVYNASDDDLQTWWTPHSRHGRYAWIQANYYTPVTVHAVEIHPGSHYPDYPDYGDLFPLNRRLARARVIFSDGTYQEIELKDRDAVQRIELEPKETTRVRLQVLETRKGQRWDDLCISQFKVLEKRKRFKEN